MGAKHHPPEPMVCLPAAPGTGTSHERIVSALAKLSTHRAHVSPVAKLLSKDPTTRDIGQRMANCAGRVLLHMELPIEGDAIARLRGGFFCGARLCPFCEWRRTRAWRTRLIEGLAAFSAEHPTHKALMLTLTVRNCPLSETGKTLDAIHAGWNRMRQCAFFPTSFWLRRTEITIGRPAAADGLPEAPVINGRLPPENRSHPSAVVAGSSRGIKVPVIGGMWAHPHIHALLLVPASYWGKNYVKQTEWQRQWQMANRLDYAPVIDVRKAYTKRIGDTVADNITPAVLEVAKYVTKSADILALGPHAVELATQLRFRRMVAVSHALRKFVPNYEPKEDEFLDAVPNIPSTSDTMQVIAQWDKTTSLYHITV